MLSNAMHKGLILSFAALLGATSAAVSAADAALERAATAMGATGLKSIRYSGDGIGYSFGQAYKPGLAWPKITVRSFARTVNYETGSMRDEILFSRAEALGGGGYPHVAPQRNEQYVSGGFAWNRWRTRLRPGRASSPIAFTSCGSRRRASSRQRSRTMRRSGRRLATGNPMRSPPFTEPGRFKAVVVHRRQWPCRPRGIALSRSGTGRYAGGDHLLRLPGLRGREIPHADRAGAGRVSGARPYGKGGATQRASGHSLPDAVKNAAERVTADKVADGVWFIAGGSHNSVAIEMKDYVILVETPLNDGRSVPVIAQVKQLVPGKPIRYVINSHRPLRPFRRVCAPRWRKARRSSRMRRTSAISRGRSPSRDDRPRRARQVGKEPSSGQSTKSWYSATPRAP